MQITLEPTDSKREVICALQNYIEKPPVTKDQLWSHATSNDKTTINHWREVWIKNVQDNFKKFGTFKSKHIGQLYSKFYLKPCIVAGAGPSLKRNGHYLKNRGNIPLISCLHNFHYMIDNEIKVDYFVNLDAGDVTAEEVYEGGPNTPDYYWDKTKDQKLLTFIGASPKLLEKWQGEVYFFTCPVPDDKFHEELEKLEKFNVAINTGGNVLGACTYIAKSFFGANPIVFMGADFAFGYENKFHPWDSKYDAELGNVLKSTDIFGNKVLTWPSYYNFKCWFDWLSMAVPGIYINCSDGGTLGSYNEGNLMSIIQMPISHLINMYHLHEYVEEQSLNPETDNKVLLF